MGGLLPVLGLIFLKFADNRYRRFEKEILKEYTKLKGTRREKSLSDIAIEKCGFYLPDHARYDYRGLIWGLVLNYQFFHKVAPNSHLMTVCT